MGVLELGTLATLIAGGGPVAWIAIGLFVASEVIGASKLKSSGVGSLVKNVIKRR